MNPTQQIAVAAGFLQALHASEPVLDSWSTLAAVSNWAGVCELIQETLGLTEAPTEDDLAAMRAYVNATSFTPASPALIQQDYPGINSVCIFNGMNGAAKP